MVTACLAVVEFEISKFWILFIFYILHKTLDNLLGFLLLQQVIFQYVEEVKKIVLGKIFSITFIVLKLFKVNRSLDKNTQVVIPLFVVL